MLFGKSNEDYLLTSTGDHSLQRRPYSFPFELGKMEYEYSDTTEGDLSAVRLETNDEMKVEKRFGSTETGTYKDMQKLEFSSEGSDSSSTESDDGDFQEGLSNEESGVENLKETTCKVEQQSEIPITHSSTKRDCSRISETQPMSNFRGRPSSCVFVASLSAIRSDDHLVRSVTEHFKTWGQPAVVKVLRDVANRPYAFVQYSTDEEAKKALSEAHHTILDGRQIRVEPARVNRTLYLESMRQEKVELKELKQLVESFGECEQITPSTLEGRHGSGWFVKFAYRDDAIRAYANLRIDKDLYVEWAQNLDSVTPAPRGPSVDTHSIFVGQLNVQVTESMLRERFGRHGQIEEINLIKRQSDTERKSSVFAFIKFSSEKSAAAAVEQENHSMFLFKTMHVQYRELYPSLQTKPDYQKDTIDSYNQKLALAPPPIRRHGHNVINEKNGRKNYSKSRQFRSVNQGPYMVPVMDYYPHQMNPYIFPPSDQTPPPPHPAPMVNQGGRLPFMYQPFYFPGDSNFIPGSVPWADEENVTNAPFYPAPFTDDNANEKADCDQQDEVAPCSATSDSIGSTRLKESVYSSPSAHTGAQTAPTTLYSSGSMASKEGSGKQQNGGKTPMVDPQFNRSPFEVPTEIYGVTPKQDNMGYHPSPLYVPPGFSPVPYMEYGVNPYFGYSYFPGDIKQMPLKSMPPYYHMRAESSAKDSNNVGNLY